MDGDLFWKLLEAEHPKAERFCRKIAADRQDGDDLYHDALLAAWRKFGTLRDVNSFRPWLYRIIVNEFRSRLRKPWWRKRQLLNEALNDWEIYDPAEIHTARRWLDRAFEALSPADKTLVILFELEGWNIPELARVFGKPQGTIKSRLSRARWKMRERLMRYLPPDKVETLAFEADYALSRSKTPTE
jgi:RNA polymerase sigma-70 factor (ECF subfamily)